MIRPKTIQICFKNVQFVLKTTKFGRNWSDTRQFIQLGPLGFSAQLKKIFRRPVILDISKVGVNIETKLYIKVEFQSAGIEIPEYSLTKFSMYTSPVRFYKTCCPPELQNIEDGLRSLLVSAISRPPRILLPRSNSSFFYTLKPLKILIWKHFQRDKEMEHMAKCKTKICKNFLPGASQFCPNSPFCFYIHPNDPNFEEGTKMCNFLKLKYE